MPRRTACAALLMPRKRVRPRGSSEGAGRAPDPAMMVCACRKLAADMRAEHAAGWGPVSILTPAGDYVWVSLAEAARSMDRQGDRWAAKVAGEAPDG